METKSSKISAIVPTIGRPESLTRLFTSLARQSHPVSEVVVADGSSDERTAAIVHDPRWAAVGLSIRRISVDPPHAVKQREAAIMEAVGEVLLFLDDDVELESECLAALVSALDSTPDAVAVMADFNNQSWAVPTKAWSIYLRVAHGVRGGEWQGRVIGPLLRYGYNPPPKDVVPCEWFGTCNSLVRRAAFEAAGGFSQFFLYRSTMNEDVDLALRVGRHGRILFCPYAKLSHFHDPSGRVSPKRAAEDDLFNRFHVLRCTCHCHSLIALGLVITFVAIESSSNLLGCLVRRRWGQTGEVFAGRLIALLRLCIAPVAFGASV